MAGIPNPGESEMTFPLNCLTFDLDLPKRITDFQTTVASQKGPQLSHITNSRLKAAQASSVLNRSGLKPGTGCQRLEATDATKPYRRPTFTAKKPCVSQLPRLEDMIKCEQYSDVLETDQTSLCIIESCVCIGQDQPFTKMMNPRLAQ